MVRLDSQVYSNKYCTCKVRLAGMFIGVTARFTDRYSETTNVVINVAMALCLEHGVIIQSNLLYGTQVAL